jgi:hypothetical protein
MSAATEEWNKRIGLADAHGTVVDVNYSPADPEGDALLQIVARSGASSLHCYPTPQALRQLAAALLDGADALEQS